MKKPKIPKDRDVFSLFLIICLVLTFLLTSGDAIVTPSKALFNDQFRIVTTSTTKTKTTTRSTINNTRRLATNRKVSSFEPLSSTPTPAGGGERKQKNKRRSSPFTNLWRRIWKSSSADLQNSRLLAARPQADDDVGLMPNEYDLNDVNTIQRLEAMGMTAPSHYPLVGEHYQQHPFPPPVDTEREQSVHLQLQTRTEAPIQLYEKPKKRPNIVKQLSYINPQTRITWMGLNVIPRKFIAYLTYQHANSTVITPNLLQEIDIDMNQETNLDKRHEWRHLWKSRRLLTDRTEFLAVYQSDKEKDSHQETNNNNKIPGQDEEKNPKRRGGFSDLLQVYTERLRGIIQDEVDDGDDGQKILTWLRDNYGHQKTQNLMASEMSKISTQDQLARLQDFVDWFRSIMPYYYDKCGTCGASFKNEEESQPQPDPDSDVNGTDLDDDDDDDDDGGTFIGYIYPNDNELQGKASRTELYHCHKCSSFTRFPRYNSAFSIIDHKRGRCGEYSMLIYRFLRALNLESRWVVDWADHVWAEVLLEGQQQQQQQQQQRWIHLDPCEAAVDRPLLYEEWGKKQTYIMAMYAPNAKRNYNNNNNIISSSGDACLNIPLIQDVTKEYTSDSWQNISRRRDESPEEVENSIMKACAELLESFQFVPK